MKDKTSTVKQQVQMFSISNRNSEVISILEKVENKSEFICQAILEKAQNTNNKNINLSEEDIENKIKDVLIKLLANNISINTASNNANEEAGFSQNKIADEIPNTFEREENEDEIDLLQSVASQW